MNNDHDLLTPFAQLQAAAMHDDIDDGQCRTAVAAAYDAYTLLLAGNHPISEPDMVSYIDGKLFFAYAMACDFGLADVAQGIGAMRLALGLTLKPAMAA